MLLPTQFGKHFWPDFSIVSGIRIDYLSPIVYTTDVLLFLLFGFFLIRQVRSIKNGKRKIKKRYIVFFLLLLSFILFNVAFSTRPLLSVYGFIKLGEFAALAVYISRIIRHRNQLEYIALLFVVSSLFESLLAIMQYINQGSLNGIFYFFGERYFTGDTPGIANASIGGTLILRPYATFPHPNVLSAYLLVAMVLLWNFVLKNNTQWIKLLCGITLIIDSIALLLSLSRVTILLWGILLLILLWRLFFHQIKLVKTKIIVAACLFVCIVVVAMVPAVHDIILRFSQSSLADESVTQRTELLGASWEMIQHHLPLGVGLDNFIPSLAPLQKPLPLGLYLQPVHNIFVLVFAECGVVGLGLFVYLFVATILRVRKQERSFKNVYYVLLLIIIITGMFDHYWLTLQQGQLLFATIIGLSWASMRDDKLFS